MKAGDSVGILVPRHIKEQKPSVYTAHLTEVHKKRCVAKIENVLYFQPPNVNIHLIVSPPKNNERLEWLVEKSVELQVTSLMFVYSERCIRKTLNIDRLSNICISAAKQSVNPILPPIKEYKSISGLLDDLSKRASVSEMFLLFHCESTSNKTPFNTDTLHTIQKQNITDIYALIGPEGDWTKNEIGYFLSTLHNVIEADMGTTRLRTETASIHVLSALRLIF
ncbi:MAG: 16S rRNA (uracil(1498)-N(3))-methyltransferase [Bacteroidia bacterium]